MQPPSGSVFPGEAELVCVARHPLVEGEGEGRAGTPAEILEARRESEDHQQRDALDWSPRTLCGLLAVAAAALLLQLASYLNRWEAPWEEEWPFLVLAPWANLAFMSWCVVWRGRFRHDVKVHVWTRRYGACALLQGTMEIAYPLINQLHLHNVANALFMLGWAGGYLIQLKLLGLKLKALGHPRAAKMVSRYALGLACSLPPCGVTYLFLALHGHNNLKSPFFKVLYWAIQLAFLTAAVLLGIGACLFFMSAWRVARCRNAGARGAAMWVVLTAVVLTGSFAMGGWSGYLKMRPIAKDEDDDAWAAWASLWSIVFTIDTAFDCMTVAFLSGLVGPPSLRRLAEEAFLLINSYSEGQRQQLYLDFLEYLDDAQIRWIRCGYLRKLAKAGDIMVRCQEVPPAEVIVGRKGFPEHWCDVKPRYILSHPWLAREHPDPRGVKLQALVQQLDELGASDSDAVFIDFMGLPQHDKRHDDLRDIGPADPGWPTPGQHPAVRTEAEEVLFQRALGSMELLYSFSSTRVIALPMRHEIAAGKSGEQYIERGWCLFEFCLAVSFSNLANADIHPSVKQLSEHVKKKKADTVNGFRELFETTHFTSKGDAEVVLKLFEQTLSEK